MKMTDYITLGRSGLRVSPLCLGTMTFGTEWGWGSDEATATTILDGYLAAGGNFLDTADLYTAGRSEKMLGKLLAERKARDRVVLATKFTFNAEPGNPNAGGNGRKNIYRALEASLRRLATDYIDLYWLHAWDTVTPVEEVVATLTDLVRAGKIRHYGFSDVPAWYAARARTLAECQGKEPLIALQLEYSLVERTIEREHVGAAHELGLAICPWSPLAGGFLAGKYRRTNDGAVGEGRLATMTNPTFQKFTERNWKILDAALETASAVGRSPAEVALSWLVHRPGITSTIIGATKLAQLESNLAALDLVLPPELDARLDEASALDPAHPYTLFSEPIQGMVHGGTHVRAWGAPAPGTDDGRRT
jgi:aryl-alcohol dehydrogenase-like predicted oxidoreductase